MTQLATSAASTTGQTRSATQRARALLAYGAAAGPVYVAVAALQVLLRDGFDIRRHAVSLLSNGDLGWIQISNFVLTGLLTIAGAVGIRHALRGQRGGTWGPRLIGVYGAGLIAAGAFVADPAFGFPIGTPAGPPVTTTWHGVAHFAAGGVGFLALIAAAFMFARHFAVNGQRAWAAFSAVTGVLFFAAFAGIASGSQSSGLNVAFTLAVILAWTWMTALMIHVRSRVANDRD